MKWHGHLAAAAAILAFGSLAQADDGRERWEIQVGAFLTDFDTSLRLSGPDAGTGITLEDTLGLPDNEKTFRGSISYRLADRHRLSLGFYTFSRSATATTTRDFTIETEDQTLDFEAGASIRSSFDWRLFPVIYRYSFLQSDRFESSIGLGVHWVKVDVGIAGNATINGEEFGAAAETEDSSAPLPVLALDATYDVTDRFRLGASAQYFGLDYNDISGDLTDIRLTGEYRWTQRFSTGIGYTYYNISYSEDNGPFRFALDYEYNGPEAYLSWRF